MGKSICKGCGEKFPTETRYIGEKYKQLKFCCQECYQNYVNEHSNEIDRDWNDLIKYLDTIYENPNYRMLGAQIKYFRDECNVSSLVLRLIIEYAIKYENYIVRQEDGLGQFYPRYYQPALEFYKKIEENKKYASEHPDLLTPEVIRVKPKNSMRKFFTKAELEL